MACFASDLSIYSLVCIHVPTSACNALYLLHRGQQEPAPYQLPHLMTADVQREMDFFDTFHEVRCASKREPSSALLELGLSCSCGLIASGKPLLLPHASLPSFTCAAPAAAAGWLVTLALPAALF